MSGWDTIQQIKRVEQAIDELGFKFAKCKHGFTDLHGALSLVPKDQDALPIYTRDAELFVGSLERLEDWLAGVQWARDYDRMCKISDDNKRCKAEQRERNSQLMRTLKEGKLIKGVEL